MLLPSRPTLRRKIMGSKSRRKKDNNGGSKRDKTNSRLWEWGAAWGRGANCPVLLQGYRSEELFLLRVCVCVAFKEQSILLLGAFFFAHNLALSPAPSSKATGA